MTHEVLSQSPQPLITTVSRSELAREADISRGPVNPEILYRQLVKNLSRIENVVGLGVFAFEEGAMFTVYIREYDYNPTVRPQNDQANAAVHEFKGQMDLLMGQNLELSTGFRIIGDRAFEEIATDETEYSKNDQDRKERYEKAERFMSGETGVDISGVEALVTLMDFSARAGRLVEAPQFIRFD